MKNIWDLFQSSLNGWNEQWIIWGYWYYIFPFLIHTNKMLMACTELVCLYFSKNMTVKQITILLYPVIKCWIALLSLGGTAKRYQSSRIVMNENKGHGLDIGPSCWCVGHKFLCSFHVACLVKNVKWMQKCTVLLTSPTTYTPSICVHFTFCTP